MTTHLRQNLKLTPIITLLVFLIIGNAAYADYAPIKFTQQKEFAGTQLELKGLGVKRVLFMKAFVAGFYFDKDSVMDDPLEDVAKQIEVHYFVAIPGKKLNEFTVDSMKDNISRQDFEMIEEEVELMAQYFVDLRPGDTFSLLYRPGLGTDFIYNNELIGTIKGEEFARALFSTWLGEKPFDGALKKKILNLNNEPLSDELALYLRKELQDNAL